MASLTPEQLAMIPQYWHKWRNFAQSIRRVDPLKAIQAAKAYCLAFKLPRQHVEVVDSPAVAWSMFNSQWHDLNLARQFHLMREGCVCLMNRWHMHCVDLGEAVVRSCEVRDLPTVELLMGEHLIQIAGKIQMGFWVK